MAVTRRALLVILACTVALGVLAASAQQTVPPAGERPVPSRDYITGRIAELRRIHTPEGIESLEQVSIGDTQQWVSIRGLHRDNPVILFIHGGPGTPMMPMAWAYQAPWEDFFTIVQWDQRGVGKNAATTDPQALLPTLSNEQIIDDAEAMLGWVRTRLNKDKVVVMGYSYGTSVGLALAQRRPEWISAYVGVGQTSGSGEGYLYERLLTLAEEAGDTEALSELRSLAPYPGEAPPIEKILTVRKWARRFNGGWYGKPTFDLMFSLDEWAPEYTQADVDAQRAATQRFTRNLTGGRGGGRPLADLTSQQVPVIVIQGRYDLHTPYEPAKAFFETIRAPYKRFITLERAAHAPMFEQPGEFLLALVREVLPLTEGWAPFTMAPAVPAYDLVLRGGTVVDGTGTARFRADVGVVGDRIAAIEAAMPAGAGRRELDAAGLIVAPGFWDNHAHLVTLEQQPLAENFLRQGITTILAPLHSQDQVLPMQPYRERVRPAPNVGLFAGHTWIRKQVMGLADRAPTDDELERMRDLVEQSMRQGALGLSTGLEYVPAAYSDTDEIVALAEVAARYGGLYVTHQRDEGPGLLESVSEVLEIGRRTGMPVQINHLKVAGADQFGQMQTALAMIDAAAAEGLAIAVDVYPYTAYSTYSDLMFPAWALADGPDAFAARVADSPTRARLVAEMLVRFRQQTGEGPDSIQFREIESHPELAGRTLADYLTARGRQPTVAEAVEALIDLQLAGGFIGVFHGMAEADVVDVIRHPRAMFETDGDLVRPGDGYPHPRSYGSFPRVLARYVREQGVLTLEQAVHKMTAQAATWLGHDDRGVVAVGAFADLVVFDPDRIADRSEYTDPHHYSEGVVHLLVNGEPVITAGAMTGATPGRYLERRPR